MELHTHARILKNNAWFIVVFSLLVGIAGLVFALVQPVQYKAVVSFDVDFVAQPETADYQYGGYYELKASELYVQDLMSWFKTPAFVRDVYTEAGFTPVIDNIAKFTNRFRTSQYSALSFVVEFTDPNRESAEKLADAIAAVVGQKASTLDDLIPNPEVSDSIDPAIANAVEADLFIVSPAEPVVAETSLPVWLVTVVAVLAGGIFSLILVYLREYFRK